MLTNMTDSGLVELMVFVGAVMGAFAATMLPFWAKLREDPNLVFEKKFIGTAIVAFVTAVALGIGVFPALLSGVADSALSLGAIFAITAAAAFGLNRGANMALPSPATEPEPKPLSVSS